MKYYLIFILILLPSSLAYTISENNLNLTIFDSYGSKHSSDNYLNISLHVEPLGYFQADTINISFPAFPAYQVAVSTTTIAPSSSGSSAGGTSRSIYDFSINASNLKFDLKQGQTNFQQIMIKNTGNRQLEIKTSTDLPEFIAISESNIYLQPDQERAITLAISSSLSRLPDIYSGIIKFDTPQLSKSIFAIIEVKKLEALFDIKVDVPDEFSIVYPGQTINADIILYNFGDLKPVDVNLFYSLRNLAGNDIIFKDDTLAITEQQSVKRVLTIPKDIESGNYLIYAKIIYGDNVEATSSSLFKVVERQVPTNSYLPIVIYSLILIILLAGIIILTIYLFKHKKMSRYESHMPDLMNIIKLRLEQGYTKEQVLHAAEKSGWPIGLVKKAIDRL